MKLILISSINLITATYRRVRAVASQRKNDNDDDKSAAAAEIFSAWDGLLSKS